MIKHLNYQQKSSFQWQISDITSCKHNSPSIRSPKLRAGWPEGGKNR